MEGLTMAGPGYFARVHEWTPTRFWINNPTDAEARKAIAAGAVHSTTNPTHTAKMLASEEMRPAALKWLQRALDGAKDLPGAAALAQRGAVGSLLNIFHPLYLSAPGKMGYVSLQGSPLLEDDPDDIIREALEARKLGPNLIAKIPVTRAGLRAIGELVARDVPVIATEIMSIAQAAAAARVYREASGRSGCAPAFFVTCIAGIFDQQLKAQLDAGAIAVEPDILFQAGVALTKRQYRLMRQNGWPGILLGGGARGLHHFTEFVGGDLHITINWKGAADRLIGEDPPVVCRMDAPTPDYVLDELMEKVPDFRRAYALNGLEEGEFADFPPVALFRSQFVAGWSQLLDALKALKEGSLC
jgi:transaldolase